MNEERAIIIGAGPAGLTAAYELIQRTKIKPVILEKSFGIGGISKTVNFNGNRIDLGGHRFFSKSDRVMDWWLNIIPLQGPPSDNEKAFSITYHGKRKSLDFNLSGPDPEKYDDVMLIRNRLSRIFYLRKFFNYPMTLDFETVTNLGILRTLKIGLGYIKARLFPIKNETSLEHFLINRFGEELYETFFKDYTHKVWGVTCSEIPSEWGEQRIKGLSISKSLKHAVKRLYKKDSTISQKDTETSLIENFLYPKYGPGQIWEKVARTVQNEGAQLFLGHEVIGFSLLDSKINQVIVKDTKTGKTKRYDSTYVFSTMPVRDFILGISGNVPKKVVDVADGLQYRDFMTVGLLVKKLKVKNNSKIPTENDILPDNWIYIQESDVKLGRLQIFNNWSPYMVKDSNTVLLGLEYFCNEGDELWLKTDDEFAEFAIGELSKCKIIDKRDVLEHVVIRVPKAYPAYFGTYDRFDTIIEFTNNIHNLFLVGRNGMHKYNNQDHSMLTAMKAVDNIIEKVVEKDNIWKVNTEEAYHESK